MRAPASLVVAAAVMAALSACTGSADGAHVIEGDDGTHLLIASSDAAQMEALGIGTLTRDEDNCLYLDGGETSELIVWPQGTELADDGAAVVIPNADPLRIGTTVEVGGGSVAVDDPSIPEFPEGCSATDIFLVNGG